MHCSSCIWLLENLAKVNDAIINSQVDFLRKTLDITFEANRLSLRALIELLSSIGYEPEINFANLHQKVQQSTNRDLYLKIGIAGFAFGNIMLFSFPDYLSAGHDLEYDFKFFFGLLSIILALPVLLYSSLDYFKSARNGLLHRTINMDVPISLGIMALFVRSSIEIISGSGTGYMDSFSGLVFLLLIGKLFQKKTFDTLSFERDYRSYFPISVLRKRGNQYRSAVLSRICVGDRLLIRNQELIPADSVLINGEGMIDYSFVTGESEPIQKKSGDIVYAGGKQIGSHLEIEVVKEISNSYLTQLWNNPVVTKIKESRITSLANRMSKYFTIIVLAIALSAGIYWISIDIATAFDAFTAVLIVACPCALALSTPFTLGNTLRLLGKKDFYLKNTAVIETLAKVDSIVFDKTGTLTQTGQTRLRFQPARGQMRLSKFEKEALRSLVSNSTHPLSQLIQEHLSEAQALPVSSFYEIPGSGISGIIEGKKFMVGSADYVGLAVPDKEDFRATRVYISVTESFLGFFEIVQEYRSGLRKVIDELQNRYDIHVISGDNTRKSSQLIKLFRSREMLHFNQDPFDKLEFIKQKQTEQQTVLMIGDGLNDAGALQQSDAGISITENINLFTPAADAILSANRFSLLPDFLRFSKLSLKIIVASFILSFLYNLVGLFFAIQGALSPLIAAILMPISSISVIVFTTGASRLLAKHIFKEKSE
jgi:Cu+-exporting ATPase